jgi:hypothetical protein
MAIQDRNLSVGTQLYARYKGETYHADVVAKEGGGVLYRLSDGREYKSPSAAGSAVMGGNACNGWAFWSVGDGATNPGPVTSTKTRTPAKSKVTPAPKPQAKRRSRKAQAGEEPPAAEAPDGDETRDDAPPATQPDDVPVTCAACGETFPTGVAATEHYYATHGKAEGDEVAS